MKLRFDIGLLLIGWVLVFHAVARIYFPAAELLSGGLLITAGVELARRGGK